uniref:Reverse transcriptase domain-containing protein n=1 Tax=Gouania willdenowi TaxID=441366 RepID=A0A8C5I986_GOUWI
MPSGASNQKKYKLSLYADDTVIYLNNPKLSIAPLMEIIQEFGSISGYTLNVNKSEIMLIG